jgi:hypothetical protein
MLIAAVTINIVAKVMAGLGVPMRVRMPGLMSVAVQITMMTMADLA